MQERHGIKDTAGWLETVIKDFIKQSPENTLKNPANDKALDGPLVGFSRGDDPIYQAFKEHVGLFHHGTCKKCIKRCPVGALSEHGYDKLKCGAYVEHAMKEYITSHFGFEVYACGLCQTGVPCESRVPKKQSIGGLS